MTFLEFLSPIKRRNKLFLFLVTCFSITIWSIFQFIPTTQKTTIYFSVKSAKTAQTSPIMDPPESAMKIAEMIAGWAKNPAFRQEILDESGVYITKFKKKITARKQNRNNVFWTITLSGNELKNSEKIKQATIKIFEKNFKLYNQDNQYPFSYTPLQTFSELRVIPASWIAIGSIILAIILAFLFIFISESTSGKIIFPRQIREIFPKNNYLEISQTLGDHDEALLKKFLVKFQNPKLIGTFPKADEYFELSLKDNIQEDDTPILMIQLGKTSTKELKNLKAIFGKNLGIIIFEK